MWMSQWPGKEIEDPPTLGPRSKQCSHIHLHDTPVKVHLKKENGEYREALIQSHTQVHQ